MDLGKILVKDVRVAKFAKVFPRHHFVLYGMSFKTYTAFTLGTITQTTLVSCLHCNNQSKLSEILRRALNRHKLARYHRVVVDKGNKVC